MSRQQLAIIDASAIFHTRDLRALLSLGRLVTTNYIINELKDVRAVSIPDVLNIEVYEIGEEEVRIARRRYHLPRLLSDADVSLIILALKLKDENPVVITDDSLLIRFLRKLGIRYSVIYLKTR
ncbi:MAG: twitching motility protein PilT [Vulcanisaeta sp. JCHS_4]|jgi:Predicted nucleic acid-binding protein, consists of a PIN domain and a Zn-ribbon module|nr:MAG: twitching motility protein PilT [Vulcanisaeta sp. JCHS_4]